MKNLFIIIKLKILIGLHLKLLNFKINKTCLTIIFFLFLSNLVNGICKSSDDHLNNMLLKLKAIDKVFISNFARCRSVIEGMKRDSHNKLQVF